MCSVFQRLQKELEAYQPEDADVRRHYFYQNFLSTVSQWCIPTVTAQSGITILYLFLIQTTLPTSMLHFSRSEMARVVMEKNHYKQRLLELQEALRRSQTLR